MKPAQPVGVIGAETVAQWKPGEEPLQDNLMGMVMVEHLVLLVQMGVSDRVAVIGMVSAKHREMYSARCRI